MKTSELIAKLQELDPSGEMETLIEYNSALYHDVAINTQDCFVTPNSWYTDSPVKGYDSKPVKSIVICVD